MTTPARSPGAITRRSVVAVVVLVALALGVAWAGRAAEGRRALADSDAALSRGDTTDAILSARIAAEARCPSCSAPEQGFAKLEKIARDAEARGDDTTAFAAWRATRAALLATSVNGTTSAQRQHADVEIARFAHRIDAAAAAAGAAPTPAAAEDRLRAALAENDIPSGTTIALVSLGGLVFLAAAARFAMAKLDKAGARASLAPLAVAAAGAALAAAGALLF